MSRPVPAQQHLEAGNFVRRHRFLHLVGQLEATIVDGVPEVFGHGAALARALVHAAFIVADPRFEIGLGAIHGKVGIAEQL
ncbi:hypothetical protein D3C87_2074000 [compost metagenome]